MTIKDLSPLSILVGICVVGLCLTPLRMSAGQGATSAAGRSGSAQLHPRDLVRIVEGDSYVVPAGKILTIKTVTAARGDFYGTVKINGQPVLTDEREYELGVTAQPGDTVTVEEQVPDAFRIGLALGFLADD